MTITTCSQCKAVLDESPQTELESRSPCPNCGSTSRIYQVPVQGTLDAKSSLGLKARHESKKRPFLEQKLGDSFSYRAKKWFYRTMRIDRENDHYSETIIDPDTNEIIHKCEEPLRNHQNHGDAKRINK